MEIKIDLGALFLFVGIVFMTAPFISGLTGFFVITSGSILPVGPNFDIGYTVGGFLLSILGYYLIRPRKQHILS